MVELIGRVSKGSRMDQIYIPKRRADFAVGSYVVVKQIEVMPKKEIKPFFYNIKHLEPIKSRIADEIFENTAKLAECDNIIITGSFLDAGFKFNDIDVIVLSDNKIDADYLKKSLEGKTGIKIHLITINNRTLIKGLSTDPLYQMMLSRCISKERFVYKVKPEINYKMLDLHLLKSKLLAENFDFLNGNEKYGTVRNAVSIALFIEGRKITQDSVDEEINKIFGKGMAQKIKDNLIIDKNGFVDKYKKFYRNLSSKILNRIKNDAKQK